MDTMDTIQYLKTKGFKMKIFIIVTLLGLSLAAQSLTVNEIKEKTRVLNLHTEQTKECTSLVNSGSAQLEQGLLSYKWKEYKISLGYMNDAIDTKERAISYCGDLFKEKGLLDHAKLDLYQTKQHRDRLKRFIDKEAKNEHL